MKKSLKKSVCMMWNRIFKNSDQKEEVLNDNSRVMRQKSLSDASRIERQTVLSQWFVAEESQTSLEQFIVCYKKGDFRDA
jgi:hypothetical protein